MAGLPTKARSTMNDNTFIGILNRMKERLQTEADKREGTWTADNLQAVANELTKIYSEDIDNILPRAFVETATGEYLDLVCGDYGIIRRAATCAEVMLEITGEPGKYVGLMVSAGEIAFLVDDFRLHEETKTVHAVCTTAGEIGNVSAGSIDQASSGRITKVSNPEDAYGGYDTEPDEVLRQRALEHIRTPANSGNIAHYIQWAKEVPGVYKVKVFDLARGPGTVDVVVIADDNTPANEALLARVKEHIEQVRPIGADVLVSAAETIAVNIKASVLTAQQYTAEAIKKDLMARMEEYFDQAAFVSRTVSYLGIVNILFSCTGVVDVTDCEINGQKDSLKLDTRQFAVMGQIDISAQEESDAE